MKFTVLGANGFIGSHLIAELEQSHIDYYAPGRNAPLSGKPLGNIIYCIGLTADFRQRPFDTIEAHVCKLNHILRNCNFASLTYLSSTRIYKHNIGIANEESIISINTSDPYEIYNSSKLTGEMLVLNCNSKNTKIVRLSNVYGEDSSSDNFISSIIRDALEKKKIIFHTSPDSAKDYISIKDIVRMLLKISLNGRQTIYNLAQGANTENAEIARIIQAETGCVVEFDQNAEKIIFPIIQINRISSEFNYKPLFTLSNDLKGIIQSFKVKKINK